MGWLEGQVDLKNQLRFNAIVRANGGGLDIGLILSNLNSKRANNSFPEYDILSIPSLTVMHPLGIKAEDIDYIVDSDVPFLGFFDDNDKVNIDLKPEDSSGYLRYFCGVKSEQSRRMRKIAREVGLLNLKLLVSISLLVRMSALRSERAFLSLIIPVSIPKVNIEQFVGVWARTRDYVRDLPDALPQKVSLDMLEASKCIDIESSKAAVVMLRRALQNALLLKGADKTTPLYEQIDVLNDKGIISNDVASLAHGVRYLGNYGAHPDEDLLNDISFEDAKLAYQVVLKILIQLFSS